MAYRVTLKQLREINEKAYEIQKDLPRSNMNRVLSWFWHMATYAVVVIASYIAMWPEPIYETHLDRLTRCGMGSLSYSVFISNSLYVLGAFFLWAIIWIVTGRIINVKPTRFAVWRIALLSVSMLSGLFAGLAWRTTIGVTGWDQCYQKREAYVIGKHWRPEVRAFTGMDSIFGIDMTIPHAKKYNIYEAIEADGRGVKK